MTYEMPHARRRAVLRVVWLFVLLELIGVVTGLAIAVQAGRSDPTPADAALVFINGTDGDTLRLNRAQEVWQSGNVVRIVLGGRDVDAAREYLVQRGVPIDALVPLQAANDAVLLADAQRALAETQLQSVLIVAEPGQMLRLLKVARDVGLQPRSLPVGTSAQVPVRELAAEVGRYFRYVLAGQ